MKSVERKFGLISIGVSLLLHVLLMWLSSLHELGGMPEVARQARRMFRIEEVDRGLVKERLPVPEWAVRIEAPAERGVLSDEILKEVEELVSREVPLPPVEEVEPEELPSEEPDEPPGPDEEAEPFQTVRQDIVQIEKEALTEEFFSLPRRIVPRVERDQDSELSVLDDLAAQKDALLSRVGGRDWRSATPGMLKETLKGSGDVGVRKKVSLLEKGEAPLGELERIEEAALREPEELLQKYPSLDELLDIRIATYHVKGDPKGFFRVTISPRPGREIPAVPKDVLFIVDCSFSIGRHRLDVTKKGLGECVKNLNPLDRFNLITFSSEVSQFLPSLVPVSRLNEKVLATYLRRVELKGNTDVYGALGLLTQPEVKPGRPLLVIFLSDGRPNLGLQKSQEIIHRITRDNALRASIYSFGGGRLINRYLLGLLAYRNRGRSLVMREADEIPRGLRALLQSISEPIFVDPVANMGSIDAAHIYPKALPNLYREGNLEIYGRYDKEEVFSLRLVGYSDGGLREVVWKQRIPEADRGGADIARRWAYHRVYHLVGKMADEGPKHMMTREIKHLSRRYGIPSPYGRTFRSWDSW